MILFDPQNSHLLRGFEKVLEVGAALGGLRQLRGHRLRLGLGLFQLQLRADELVVQLFLLPLETKMRSSR